MNAPDQPAPTALPQAQGSGIPPAARRIANEYEQRLRFVKNKIEEADRLKDIGDWSHVFEALSSAHHELALCMMDAAFLR